jgi:3-hydroxyacyl-[acyl-carrier-protein] dehydratase
MSEFQLPMMTQDIEKVIPHRYPFLLIDRVSELVIDQYIVAHRHISASDIILQGHFPGHPIVPGVLLVEGAAQAAGVLGKMSYGRDCKSFLLVEVSEARFRRQVVPGEVLTYKVRSSKQRAPFYWFEGEAFVDGELAAQMKFSAKMS